MHRSVVKHGKVESPHTVRCNVSMSGQMALRVWHRPGGDEYEETKLHRRELAHDFRDCRIEACATIGYMRFQARRFCLCITLTDVVLQQQTESRPFL